VLRNGCTCSVTCKLLRRQFRGSRFFLNEIVLSVAKRFEVHSSSGYMAYDRGICSQTVTDGIPRLPPSLLLPFRHRSPLLALEV
jgi:hypothetical protein